MAPEPQPPPERPETVTVTSSSGPYHTLWDIAEQLFEDGSRWESIYQANRDTLDNPNELRLGMTLRLPMEIYPAHIRAAAGAFDTEKNELGEFVKGAAAELNTIGAFWGTGELGTKFFRGEGGRMGYEAVSGQVIDGVDVLRNAYHEVPARLRSTADRVQVADWDSVLTVMSALPTPDPDEPVWGEDR
ncbi:LysM peptidoglycan-binding domain-containing protein [Nonomuraea rhizosphaerae]|uniref:LysM peptidoglycan-binding domain-containing protein n=1 Tax=Nonomuraea rhizosphaerae TaxID=2665663 RepID=UPI001C5CCDB9|nr:LysM peptidoglycan-binding domain-containing protein [Nonomuraea rhizosphaerae]